MPALPSPSLFLLEQRRQANEDLVLFKVPSSDTSWRNITLSQFQSDVEAKARYWADALQKHGIEPRDSVGVWLKGLAYEDLVEIWGIMRAGFVPQMVSLRLLNPTVVYEMLSQSGAKALVHEESLEPLLKDSPILLLKPSGLTAKDLTLPVPDFPTFGSPDDVCLIQHTSGSTSGSPKIIPCTVSQLKYRQTKLATLTRYQLDKHPTILFSGNFCHAAAQEWLTLCLSGGGCLLLPHSSPYPTSELILMMQNGGLDHLAQFPSFLAKTLYEAQRNPDLLALMKKHLKTITYSGDTFDPDLELWARNEGFRVIGILASTELSLLLASDGGWDDTLNAPTMQPYEKGVYEFAQIAAQEKEARPLLELLVLPESPDCPPSSLCDPVSGKFRTGDLFIESSPGHYVSRGRNDDWINMENGMRCDAAVIASNAMQTCGADLINAAIALGSGRPSPVLVVEPKDANDAGSSESGEQLAREILSRILPFNERRYVHERVVDAKCILVVEQGSLPRTAAKGNIRRKETEKIYKDWLDKIFSSSL